MNKFYEELVERIREEAPDLDRLVQRSFKLVPDKMKTLMSDLPELWSQVQAELLAFADFLSELTQANQT
jgi:hypothetical protein